MHRSAAVGCMILAPATMAAGAQLVCPDSLCTVPKIDSSLLHTMHALQQPWLTTFFSAITWLGSMYLLLPASLLLAWHFSAGGRIRAALLVPLALAGAWAFAHAGKIAVQRPRPDLFSPLIEMPADLAFPSAHAMQSAAFATALLIAYRNSRRVPLAMAVASAVVVVAVSRLYLQVHFPSDVIFGLIGGALLAIGLGLLLRARS